MIRSGTGPCLNSPRCSATRNFQSDSFSSPRRRAQMCWVNKPLMEQLAIRLGYQPKSFWPGTRKTIAKSLVIPASPFFGGGGGGSPPPQGGGGGGGWFFSLHPSF